MRRLGLWSAALLAPLVVHGTVLAAEGEPDRLRGTLVGVDGKLLTVMNDDEETVEIALTEDTGVFAVTPAKWSAIEPGQFVGITSIESGGQRVALEVHIFADDLRGTAEGHHPWDLVKDPNTMTNATIAEIEEVSAAERKLRLTYQEGEGENAAQGEQVITVPDFVDVVFLAKSDDPGLLAADRRVFLLVREAGQGPAAAIAIAVGVDGAIPPM